MEKYAEPDTVSPVRYCLPFILLLPLFSTSFAQAPAQPLPPLHLLAHAPMAGSNGAARLHLNPGETKPSVFARSRFARSRFARTFGAGVLGGAVGGGLGLLFGMVELEDPDNDPWDGTYGSTEVHRLPMPLLGLWLGSTVGVLAASHTRPSGMPIALSGVGSVLGSIAGAATAGAMTRRDAPISLVVGALIGSAAGAVSGIALWEHNQEHP